MCNFFAYICIFNTLLDDCLLSSSTLLLINCFSFFYKNLNFVIRLFIIYRLNISLPIGCYFCINDLIHLILILYFTLIDAFYGPLTEFQAYTAVDSADHPRDRLTYTPITGLKCQ